MSTHSPIIGLNKEIAQRLGSLPSTQVCGLDEVGRGPLAGPVTAGCVILSSHEINGELADSKSLSAKARDKANSLILEKAVAWGLGWVWPEEIESLNIHHASLLAMQRAFANLLEFATVGQELQLAVVDGKFCPALPLPVMAQIKGDALIPVISAASIIAKVARDRWIEQVAKQYPGYGLERHKGYPTKEHVAALKRLGPCPIHRQSWVWKILHASSSEIAPLSATRA
jgi:ribonuclease HII